MSQPIGRKLMHVVGAIILTAGLAWFQQSIQVDPPTYEPPRWWNFNGRPLFGVYAWSVMIAAIWSLVFAELVESTYTAYQRMFEQSMQIVMASLVAYFVSTIGLGWLPWWAFAGLVIALGIAFGILEHRRLTGQMANAFTALVAGFAFGPTAGVVVGIVGFGVTLVTATLLNDMASGNAPFEM